MEEEVLKKVVMMQGEFLVDNGVGGDLGIARGNAEVVEVAGMEEDCLSSTSASGVAEVLEIGSAGLREGVCGFLPQRADVLLEEKERGDDPMVVGGAVEISPAFAVGDTGAGLSKKVILDWKNAVLGKGVGLGGNEVAVGGLGEQEEMAAAMGGEDVKVASPAGVTAERAHEWVSNHCRKIVFDATVENFLEDDGVTVNMDEVAATDCERRLGRAIVGKILG